MTWQMITCALIYMHRLLHILDYIWKHCMNKINSKHLLLFMLVHWVDAAFIISNLLVLYLLFFHQQIKIQQRKKGKNALLYFIFNSHKQCINVLQLVFFFFHWTPTLRWWFPILVIKLPLLSRFKDVPRTLSSSWSAGQSHHLFQNLYQDLPNFLKSRMHPYVIPRQINTFPFHCIETITVLIQVRGS